jgi:hypothetical protein
VVEGSVEIQGDPALGIQNSYRSWKKACQEWKKELSTLNPEQVISAQCGVPKKEVLPDHLILQTSTGKYKIRVKIRENP